MLLVIPQVFQTFSCEDYEEISESYLNADARIDCNAPKHTAYMIYAAVMIVLCKFGSFTMPLKRMGVRMAGYCAAVFLSMSCTRYRRRLGWGCVFGLPIVPGLCRITQMFLAADLDHVEQAKCFLSRLPLPSSTPLTSSLYHSDTHWL